MTEILRLARHLSACCDQQVEPNLAAADAKAWLLALSDLVSTNRLDQATYAAARLAGAFSTVNSFARTAMLLDRLPPAVDDPHFARFVDDPAREVQVVRRRGASTVVFAFTGRLGALGLPLSMMHRWFGSADVHVVYLRDPFETGYCAGIPSLASDRAGTIEVLRAIAGTLGAQRMACYGNSSGGYGALLYGLTLPAVSVLAFGAVTHLSDDMKARVGNRTTFMPGPDLRPLFAAAPRSPRVRLVFGMDHPEDAENARRLDGLPGIVLDPVEAWAGHDAHLRLIEQNRFAEVLGGFLSDEPANPRVAGPPACDGTIGAEAGTDDGGVRTIACLSIGKTSSMALAAAIRDAGFGQAEHIHYLGPRAIAIKRPMSGPMLDRVCAIAERLQDPEHRFTFVSCVRDPIDRIVAQAFQNAEAQLAATGIDIVADRDALVAWYERGANREIATEWFDDTFKVTFGLDFRSHPFDHQRRSLRFASDRLRLLVLRQEDPAAGKETELGWLLHRDSVPLPVVNDAASKPYAADYRRLRSTFVAPQRWLETFYDSDVSRHFYTAEERAVFRARWSGTG